MTIEELFWQPHESEHVIRKFRIFHAANRACSGHRGRLVRWRWGGVNACSHLRRQSAMRKSPAGPNRVVNGYDGRRSLGNEPGTVKPQPAVTAAKWGKENKLRRSIQEASQLGETYIAPATVRTRRTLFGVDIQCAYASVSHCAYDDKPSAPQGEWNVWTITPMRPPCIDRSNPNARASGQLTKFVQPARRVSREFRRQNL
jgi:hypothetical protein